LRLKTVLCLLGVVIFLAACSQTQDNDQDVDLGGEVTFEAQILEVHETYLMVTPNEGETELRSADRITVSIEEAKILDKEGNEMDKSIFNEGMEVEIVYDGAIAESYPAQILNCYEIRMLQ